LNVDGGAVRKRFQVTHVVHAPHKTPENFQIVKIVQFRCVPATAFKQCKHKVALLANGVAFAVFLRGDHRQVVVDQLKAENEQISKERLIFLISSVSLAVLLFLIYIVVNQRMKNKELKFIHQQQKANEEIYNLMLAQQDKIEEGRTKEKKRISEELHDGVLGKLFGTRLSLDSLNLVNTEEAIKNRGEYINELKNIETEIRKISHDLNSDFISDSGFMDIISTLVDNQTKAYGLTFDFEENSLIDWDSFANKTKIHIYRMLQETLQNIYKHAEATHVKIAFSRKKDVILLTIKDNGKGFNVNKARKGIGLKNIDSRVKEIGGRAEIVSKINEGTTIDISIPNS